MSIDSKKLRKRSLWDYVIGISVYLFLFVTALIVNAFQMLSLIIIRPFSRKSFRGFNRFLADTWWGWLDFCVRGIRKVEIEVIGDTLPYKENAIVISNHQSMADIPVFFKSAIDCGRLGDLKWFAKHALKKLPALGWGLQFLDCIFVKRNWHSDKEKIEKTFKKFFDEDIPLWLMIFPEGTRITDKKKEDSQSFAKKNDLPILENVLIPRSKGFTSSVYGLKGHVKAVYDMTIKYEGGAPSLMGFFYGDTKKVTLKVQRICLDSLPQDESELANWLLESFKKKDLFLNH